jgi:ABC-type Mn2+/Zn2+ transport system permease subunit
VNALLVIPAATAKLLARSLTQLFVLAPLFGTTSALAGLAVSYAFDLPSGPAIVIVAGLGFLAAWLWRARVTIVGRRTSGHEEAR